MLRSAWANAFVALPLLTSGAHGVSVSADDDDSIRSAASIVAKGLMAYYTDDNGDHSGVLDAQKYAFWETGAFHETFLEYWAATGDDTYNDAVTNGLKWETGDDDNFIPANYSASEGNDDQGIWAGAALVAAEYGLGADSHSSNGSYWTTLASNVFENFVSRWDDETCGGGLRWQLFPTNTGYNYKNAMSNGVFFDLAARLAMVTGNKTYSDWASKVFEWEQKIGFVDGSYRVFDGANTSNQCKQVSKMQFSANAAVHLRGAAVMYNLTDGSDVWRRRTAGLLDSAKNTFTKDDILVEISCEKRKTCTIDMRAFKSIMIRSLHRAQAIAPFTAAAIQPLISANGKAAASSCTGKSSDFSGPDGTACGFSWTDDGKFDGLTGPGEQMNALEALIALMPWKNADSTSGGDSGGSQTSSSSTPSDTQANSGGNGDDEDVGPFVKPPLVLGTMLLSLGLLVAW